MQHTILGAGGSIGNALTHELLKSGENVRQVSRSKYEIAGTESVKADLTSYHETAKSVQNSDIVYLCAGLPYNSKVWNEQWPKIMRNTIDACKNAGARLIFFDNVYMYGRVEGKMTESTSYNPCSRKGEVRATIARLLEEEMKSHNLDAMIARAADLYGPYISNNSLPFMLVIDKMMKGGKAQWLADAGKIHSYTYTLDCARALCLLYNRAECYNQIWHLPTCKPAVDGKTFIQMVADELGVPSRYSVMKKWMIKMAGMFNTTIRESVEMLYQSEFDYYFDSTKFNEFFQYTPVSYQEGIRETIQFLKNR